jgi:hypothetical protein
VKQQALDLATSRALAGKTSLDDLDVIAKQVGPFRQQVWQFLEKVVSNLSCGTVYQQETRLVSPVGRDLGYCLFGQVIIESGSFHDRHGR